MSIGVVVTTRGTALAVAMGGDEIATGNAEPVYLISMDGHFTAYVAKRPAGVPPPKGEYLSIVVDQKTLQIRDYGLGSRPARLPSNISCWTPLP